jgi:hypothetical protein
MGAGRLQSLSGFQNYAPSFQGSEAEVFRNHLAIRSNQDNFLYTVRMGNGTNIDISSGYFPEELNVYIIRSEDIARLLGVVLASNSDGTRSVTMQERNFRAAQGNLYGAHYDAVDDALTSGAIEILRAVPNPIFQVRSMSSEQQDQVTELEAQIQTVIQDLDANHSNSTYVYTTGSEENRVTHSVRYYLNPDRTDSNSTSGLSIYSYPNQRNAMNSALQAIEERHPEEFVKNMVKLVTMISKKKAHQRSAFVRNFSVLYTTFNFPSEGTRNQVFHFALRCGQFSTD